MGEGPTVTVGILIFNPKREILLLKSHKWGDRYIFPCGHVELFEKLEDAAKREVKEETGLNITNLELLGPVEFLKSKEFHKKDMHFIGMQFKGKTEETEIKLNEEASEYIWIDPRKSLELDLEWATKLTIEKFALKE